MDFADAILAQPPSPQRTGRMDLPARGSLGRRVVGRVEGEHAAAPVEHHDVAGHRHAPCPDWTRTASTRLNTSARAAESARLRW